MPEDEQCVAPALLLLKGHPGTGKSSLAEGLARLLHWPLVDKDDARDCFEGEAGLRSVPQSVLNTLAYRVMFRTAARQLKVGNSVVVDCPLSRKSLYADAQTLAAEYNADLAIVECVTLEKDIWQARLAARSRSDSSDRAHKPADWETVQNLIAGYQGACNWTSDGSCKLSKHVVIDTSRGSAMELAASVATRIGLLSPPADATAGWPNPSRTGLED